MKILFKILLLLCFTNSNGQNRIVLKNVSGSDSIVQIFYKNGQLFFQVPYKNGKQNGWYEQYHENGSVSSKDFRVDGKTIDGNYVSLFDNGNIYQIGVYKKGCPIGNWYTYTREGEPFKIFIYDKKGKLVKLKVWNLTKNKWEKSQMY